jgi:hypothetical protein
MQDDVILTAAWCFYHYLRGVVLLSFFFFF